MSGSYLTAFEAVNQITVHIHILNDDATQLRTAEHVHHLMNTGLHCLLQITGRQQMLNLQCQITENHRECEVLQITCARMELVPFAFRVVNFGKDNLKSLLGYVCILLISRGKT